MKNDRHCRFARPPTFRIGVLLLGFALLLGTLSLSLHKSVLASSDSRLPLHYADVNRLDAIPEQPNDPIPKVVIRGTIFLAICWFAERLGRWSLLCYLLSALLLLSTLSSRTWEWWL